MCGMDAGGIEEKIVKGATTYLYIIYNLEFVFFD